ncbi:SGNH/GDSL hydrolase family protein [Herbiconiux sp. CPCC 203407]|uniref:SGNH/GDSL hydrolase family protein n=1 Tax=Herbiconiux oxytropis TaxID=2970915 RepID=A0AA41XJT3_9MICO|nr:SGNH/GDSL hydrolase family protein [Herbiconiux oxytropis]MCS5723235.1 SGNH/GDSL hydrolase family protein [Herbiconiux oxytropis]MCS5727890.1 SGNH/GDSL hydrolase family protein [Herbiconiux oxytropis]
MVTFLGDSYTGGSRQDSGEDARYPKLVGEALDISVHSAGLGGSGYVAVGTANKALPTLVNKIHVDSDVVVVFGSRNDKAGYQAVYDAASGMYGRIRERFPDAKLVAVGPAWPASVTPDFVIESDNAVRDAAAENGATYVSALEWLKGDPALIGADNVHPNDAGHAYLAAQFEQIVRAALEEKPPAS